VQDCGTEIKLERPRLVGDGILISKNLSVFI
jgi:hypothetical protein